LSETFSEGRESVFDEEGSGRLATSRTEENIANLSQIVRENRRLAVRSIAKQVNIDRETVRKILTEYLDKRKECAKMVPKELTEEKKHGTVCKGFFATKQLTVSEHPDYSPDLASNGFFSVPEDKVNVERNAF
jgi:hypothetical protein